MSASDDYNNNQYGGRNYPVGYRAADREDEQRLHYGNNYNDAEHGYEMNNYPHNQDVDINHILNRLPAIENEVVALEAKVEELRILNLRNRAGSTDDIVDLIQTKVQEITAGSKVAVANIRAVKATPGASLERNAAQVDLTYQRVRSFVESFAKFQFDSQNTLRADQLKTYRNVTGDSQTSDEDAMDLITREGPQLYSKLMLQSGRREQATTVRDAAQNRNQEMQRIKDSMIILAQLQSLLESQVQEQAPQIEAIERKGEEAQVLVAQGEQNVTQALKSRLSANKKIKYTAIVCIIILIIVGVIVAVVVVVNNKKNK